MQKHLSILLMKKVTEVTEDNYDAVKWALTGGSKGFDTETTGVGHDDRPFLLTVAKEDEVFAYWLDTFKVPESILDGTLYSHNLKFDYKMLTKIGYKVAGRFHCTMVAERLLRNDRLPKEYNLEETAKRYGMEKDKRVDAYIKEHGLFEVQEDGEKKVKVPRFDRVPRPLMLEYAGHDAWLHLQIGLKQEVLLETTV